MTDITADVIIVGSGVAGALIADQLAGEGVSVAILEAGDPVDRFDAVDTFHAAVIKTPESAYPVGPDVDHPLSWDMDYYYRQIGPAKFKSTYVKVVGGTTWHWLGTAIRMSPEDFRLKSTFGRGEDWPLSYDELEPYYARAEEELGVSGAEGSPPSAPRSTDFPMSPIPLTYLDKKFAEKLAGTPYVVSPTPQARNSVDHDDRPACCGSGSCIPVCPVQAKYDATVHVDRAVSKGATLHSATTVTRVETGADGKISGVEFTRRDGTKGRATGKLYVIAAHAMETPRLLLASAGEHAPNGVANSSDQVGRNLMDHPSQLSWAKSIEPVWPYRGPLSTSGIENLSVGDFRGERGAFRIEIGNDGHSWPTGAPLSTAQELIAQGLRGAELDNALKHQAARHVRMAALVEQLPDPENRITLHPTEKDRYGVPLPQIHYSIDDYAKAGLEAAAKAHDEIFAALGTENVHHDHDFNGSGHIIGTCRMGDDPATSVVNADLLSHDHDNLYIAGSSVFPTSATANPTLTIAALSLRAAEGMLRELKGE
ncbi:MAG: GMC family oxidoreductase [Devosia sp.]|uniref:GMC family oxidoreductase n=1 Tax=unclassified Devosia TaxID=196773 RepID=UPI0019DBB17D|nr:MULTISPECIES: GMC family oxidoreductase [unclassified Devosia]MBF0679486.1 GMC family oxidoreductase [Devosia sp.]WEJ33897.1 GMC family oxidoreductase [Devosia sp. SD17-2]